MAAAGVPIYGGYGGSEFGNPTQSWDELSSDELRHNADWAWMRFSDAADARMEPQGDGTYELVVYVSNGYCHARCGADRVM